MATRNEELLLIKAFQRLYFSMSTLAMDWCWVDFHSEENGSNGFCVDLTVEACKNPPQWLKWVEGLNGQATANHFC